MALEYRVVPVNIGRGDQFKKEFLIISPNNRMPAIVDHNPADGGKAISVFEAGAILLYLAVFFGTISSTESKPTITQKKSKTLKKDEVSIGTIYSQCQKQLPNGKATMNKKASFHSLKKR